MESTGDVITFEGANYCNTTFKPEDCVVVLGTDDGDRLKEWLCKIVSFFEVNNEKKMRVRWFYTSRDLQLETKHKKEVIIIGQMKE